MSFYVPEQLEEEKAVEEIYNNAVRPLCYVFGGGCVSNGDAMHTHPVMCVI